MRMVALVVMRGAAADVRSSAACVRLARPAAGCTANSSCRAPALLDEVEPPGRIEADMDIAFDRQQLFRELSVLGSYMPK